MSFWEVALLVKPRRDHVPAEPNTFLRVSVHAFPPRTMEVGLSLFANAERSSVDFGFVFTPDGTFHVIDSLVASHASVAGSAGQESLDEDVRRAVHSHFVRVGDEFDIAVVDLPPDKLRPSILTAPSASPVYSTSAVEFRANGVLVHVSHPAAMPTCLPRRVVQSGVEDADILKYWGSCGLHISEVSAHHWHSLKARRSAVAARSCALRFGFGSELIAVPEPEEWSSNFRAFWSAAAASCAKAAASLAMLVSESVTSTVTFQPADALASEVFIRKGMVPIGGGGIRGVCPTLPVNDLAAALLAPFGDLSRYRPAQGRSGVAGDVSALDLPEDLSEWCNHPAVLSTGKDIYSRLPGGFSFGFDVFVRAVISFVAERVDDTNEDWQCDALDVVDDTVDAFWSMRPPPRAAVSIGGAVSGGSSRARAGSGKILKEKQQKPTLRRVSSAKSPGRPSTKPKSNADTATAPFAQVTPASESVALETSVSSFAAPIELPTLDIPTSWTELAVEMGTQPVTLLLAALCIMWIGGTPSVEKEPAIQSLLGFLATRMDNVLDREPSPSPEPFEIPRPASMFVPDFRLGDAPPVVPATSVDPELPVSTSALSSLAGGPLTPERAVHPHSDKMHSHEMEDLSAEQQQQILQDANDEYDADVTLNEALAVLPGASPRDAPKINVPRFKAVDPSSSPDSPPSSPSKLLPTVPAAFRCHTPDRREPPPPPVDFFAELAPQRMLKPKLRKKLHTERGGISVSNIVDQLEQTGSHPELVAALQAVRSQGTKQFCPIAMHRKAHPLAQFFPLSPDGLPPSTTFLALRDVGPSATSISLKTSSSREVSRKEHSTVLKPVVIVTDSGSQIVTFEVAPWLRALAAMETYKANASPVLTSAPRTMDSPLPPIGPPHPARELVGAVVTGMSPSQNPDTLSAVSRATAVAMAKTSESMRTLSRSVASHRRKVAMPSSKLKDSAFGTQGTNTGPLQTIRSKTIVRLANGVKIR